MRIGLLALSPLTQRLLTESLSPRGHVTLFTTVQDLAQGIEAEDVLWGVEEQARAFQVMSLTHQENFLKPLKISHLLAHLHGFVAGRSYPVGPYVFFPAHRRVELSDGEGGEAHVIHLREKETELLLFLVTAPDGYASRQTLLSHVWGVQPDMETRTLESHIHQLRQKLDATDTGLKVIHNVGQGYQLKS